MFDIPINFEHLFQIISHRRCKSHIVHNDDDDNVDDVDDDNVTGVADVDDIYMMMKMRCLSGRDIDRHYLDHDCIFLRHWPP